MSDAATEKLGKELAGLETRKAAWQTELDMLGQTAMTPAAAVER